MNRPLGGPHRPGPNRHPPRPLAATVPTTLRPVLNRRGVVLRSARGRPGAVVIADLHLGLAARAESPLGPPGASAPELAASAVGICREARVRRLIVAGDVKHPIVGVPSWLRPVVFDVFATLLHAGIRPEVVLGNHDVGLERHLPREVRVHPPEGAVLAGVGVFHGHRWPSNAVLRRPTLLAGHLHPGYRFAPTAEDPAGKRPCWVRVAFDRERPALRADGRPAGVRELLVVPPFHPLAGLESLNRDRPERGRSFLYRRFLARGVARAYLLDGTDLGPLPTELPGGSPRSGA